MWLDKQIIYNRSRLHLVTPSQWLKSKVERSILKDHPVTLIPNGVNTRIFTPMDKAMARQAAGLPLDAFIIGSVAHSGALTNQWKGGATLQSVLTTLDQRNQRYLFLNIGGNDQGAPTHYINTGHISDERALNLLYACLDLFVYTPKADNCPLVVLEALACGVPVVTTDTGGVPELVRDGKEGCVLKREDVAGLVYAVEQLRLYPETAAEMSGNARQRAVTHFDHDLVVKQCLALYEQERMRCSEKSVCGLHLLSSRPECDVSIILATKNRASLLEEMLNSLRMAAHNIRYEIIAIDGDSNDNTLQILRKHGATVFAESTAMGPGRHSWPQLYNFGFSKARGKWAMYASDDIVFHEGCLDYAVRELNKHNDTIAGGIFFYRNCEAQPGWEDFGIDYTYGQKLLMNYGLVRLDRFIEVGGLDESYEFYCADGDLCYRLYQKYNFVVLPSSLVTHNNILDAQKQNNYAQADQDIYRYISKWKNLYSDVLPNPRRFMLSSYPFGTEESEQVPIRLHLGCGRQYLEGYVNIDYPPDRHNLMPPTADVHADITQLSYEQESIDEIRLHHVFEHFNRVTALGLLIRWHGWLKPGGILHIETPDFEGCARTFLSTDSTRVRMGIIRHLAGDQSASWGYHIDHWFPQRFSYTLEHLGYEIIRIDTEQWPQEPYLANVHAVARKIRRMSESEHLEAADRILWDSTVADTERPMWEIWRSQLRAFLSGGIPEGIFYGFNAASATSTLTTATFSSHVDLKDIHDFNRRERDRWVAMKAATILPDSLVLDVGAGTCPYRHLFKHCHYLAHDFKKYTGEKLGGTTEYGDLDIISEITELPIPDASLDVILCTEVLEHVPEPILAVQEMVRVLKPGGRVLLTAPLGSGLHQLPYHFYGGFTPQWYRMVAERLGLEVAEITANGGFFKLLAQECARVAWTFPQHRIHHGNQAEVVFTLFNERLPRYLFDLDGVCQFDQFIVGYFVEMVKGKPERQGISTYEQLLEIKNSFGAACRISR